MIEKVEIKRTYENAGVYKIQNKVNGKYYIGSAKDFSYRWNNHEHFLKLNSHHNNHLQNAYNKHGENNFEFIIIEKIELTNVTKQEAKSILIIREQFYLNILDATNTEKGYNVLPTAGSRLGYMNPVAIEKKKKLLQMARNGEHKPIRTKHEFTNSLICYTKYNGSSFDPEFDKKIRELRPDWFTHTVYVNKEKIIEKAKNGENRPKSTTKLGASLCNYIQKDCSAYNSEFDKLIRELRPDWFIDRKTKMVKNKEKLLKMATNNEHKPREKKHTLGTILASYTQISSSSFDPIFNEKIRELRPDWFINCK